MNRTSRYRLTVTQALADTIAINIGMRETRSSTDSGKLLDKDGLPKVGDIVGGLYRLVRLLGKGVFGFVFLAERVDVPEHRVALKVMLRDVTETRNIERELVMLAAAGHPNVVQLKDHGITNRYVWFTMPVYEGKTLEEELEHRLLSLEEAYDVFLPIARGVEALHHAGLRHQDLKPENIFLAQFAGRVHPIILDLGVAAETNSEFVAGTVLFAAPEQTAALLGDDPPAPMSAKVDTYALAATLLLSLVGWEHFPGANAGDEGEMAQAQRVRAEYPVDDEALPNLQGPPREKLQAAFRQWFAISPADRPDMGHMAQQLDVLLEQRRDIERQERQKRLAQKTKLQRARLAVAGLLVVGTVAALGVYSKRRTIALAQELQDAKELGAASYDRLETCVAASRLTAVDLNRCRRQRKEDQQEFRRTMKQLTSSGNRRQQVLAAQVADSLAKLQKCQDRADEAASACQRDKQSLSKRCDEHTEQLQAELDMIKSNLVQCSTETQTLKTELGLCQSANSSPMNASTSNEQDTPYTGAPQPQSEQDNERSDAGTVPPKETSNTSPPTGSSSGAAHPGPAPTASEQLPPAPPAPASSTAALAQPQAPVHSTPTPTPEQHQSPSQP